MTVPCDTVDNAKILSLVVTVRGLMLFVMMMLYSPARIPVGRSIVNVLVVEFTTNVGHKLAEVDVKLMGQLILLINC
jgi:hypothetical protein